MKVFVAGGSGVIGRRLVPELVSRGHRVTATTAHADRLDLVRRLGAEAVVMDGLDAVSVGEAVAACAPEVIVHQMTAVPAKISARHPERSTALTTRLRTEGLDHLVAAAEATSVSHMVAQSYASWNGIREGGRVKTEADPLDPEHIATPSLRHIEDTVVPLGGAVLRYGWLYGAGASDALVEPVRKRRFPMAGDGNGYVSWVHVDDAVSATVSAVEQRASGVFNIVDDEPAPVSEWLPYLAECLGAKPPRRVPVWLLRPLTSDFVVWMMTDGYAFSNAEAKAALGWELRYPSWRRGFKEDLA